MMMTIDEPTWIEFRGHQGKKYALWDGYMLSKMMTYAQARKEGAPLPDGTGAVTNAR